MTALQTISQKKCIFTKLMMAPAAIKLHLQNPRTIPKDLDIYIYTYGARDSPLFFDANLESS